MAGAGATVGRSNTPLDPVIPTYAVFPPYIHPLPAMVNKVSKSRSSKPSPLKRIARSLPSAALKRRPHGLPSPPPPARARPDAALDAPLDDRGAVPALPHGARRRDGVRGLVAYARATMFDALPAERSGMNSTRTAEVLRFQRQMPPLVTAAHVHALRDEPTRVAREMGRLVEEGTLRRVAVRGRGFGSASLGECVVLTREWVARVREEEWSEEIKGG